MYDTIIIIIIDIDINININNNNNKNNNKTCDASTRLYVPYSHPLCRDTTKYTSNNKRNVFEMYVRPGKRDEREME